MPRIDYSRMARLLVRCREIAEATDAKPSVKRVYTDRVAGPAEAYLAAHRGLPVAEGAAGKEVREAAEALARLDQPYREARAVALAYVRDAVLPETLSALRTDTDRKMAVEDLVDRIDDHVGEPWADELLAGPFGTEAPKAIQELEEAVAASGGLAKARLRRAETFGPAYEAYLAFKAVVRTAYGPKSREYHRIHLRQDGKLAVDDEGGEA